MSAEFTPEQEKLVREREQAAGNKAAAWVVNILKKHYGDEVYKVLAKSHEEPMRKRFRSLAEKSEDTSIETFVKHIWEELPAKGFEYTKEETESGIQIKCTKCPPAEMAKCSKTTELMFYICCEQDQYMADGFNPNIGFKRTKTLMQGDECCDHFYYYKDKNKHL